jgi:hypothetical protein
MSMENTCVGLYNRSDDVNRGERHHKGRHVAGRMSSYCTKNDANQVHEHMQQYMVHAAARACVL